MFTGFLDFVGGRLVYAFDEFTSFFEGLRVFKHLDVTLHAHKIPKRDLWDDHVVAHAI